MRHRKRKLTVETPRSKQPCVVLFSDGQLLAEDRARVTSLGSALVLTRSRANRVAKAYGKDRCSVVTLSRCDGEVDLYMAGRRG